MLDYYINVLGSWDDGLNIAQSAWKNMDFGEKHSYSYQDKFFCACILSVCGDPDSRNMFDHIVENETAPSSYELFTLLFRKLVFSVKRSNNQTDIKIDYADYTKFVDSIIISDAEKRYFRAMLKNIIALNYGKLNEIERSEKSVKSALSDFESIEFDQLSPAYGGVSVYH